MRGVELYAASQVGCGASEEHAGVHRQIPDDSRIGGRCSVRSGSFLAHKCKYAMSNKEWRMSKAGRSPVKPCGWADKQCPQGMVA
jgi:hypothetical protein